MKDNGITHQDAERQVFGATHAEVGAYLLGLWGLPNPIIEAVAFHHDPGQCLASGFGPLTAVHCANGLVYIAKTPLPADSSAAIDMDYLAKLGLVNQLPAWIEACARVSDEE